MIAPEYLKNIQKGINPLHSDSVPIDIDTGLNNCCDSVHNIVPLCCCIGLHQSFLYSFPVMKLNRYLSYNDRRIFQYFRVCIMEVPKMLQDFLTRLDILCHTVTIQQILFVST